MPSSKINMLPAKESTSIGPVLVVGDLILDTYIWSSVARISPEAPVQVAHVQKETHVLGGAANIANNLIALDIPVIITGTIGRDSNGQILEKLLRDSRIPLDGIFHLEVETTSKKRIIAQNQQLLRIDHETTQFLPKKAETFIWNFIAKNISTCSMVILSDYAKGVLTKQLCQKIIALCKRNDIAVIVDPKPQHKNHYKGCTLLTPNSSEAAGISGIPENGPASITNMGKKIKKSLGCDVIITRGAQGMKVFEGANVYDIQAHPVEVYDVTGAGDTVIATVCMALLRGNTLRKACDLASLAASIVIQKLGTATVSWHELKKYIEANVAETKPATKILSLDELVPVVESLKKAGRVIVTTNGTFDILHYGHIKSLEEAKKQGDVLIVGVNSNSSVKKYKSPDRPIHHENVRMEMLAALTYTDYIFLFHETTPIEFLEKIKPHVHANGEEYGNKCVEAETVRKHGRLHLLKKIDGFSTSALIGKTKRYTF